MTKLTDTQLVILSAAAQREDGSIHPLPKSLKGGAADKVIAALTRKGLVERIEDERLTVPDLVRVTRAGLEAIGVDLDEGARAADEGDNPKRGATARRKRKKAATKADRATKAPHAREGSKQALVIGMLERPEGATLDQLAEATGWQRHTVRGAISGALKKKLGLKVESEKVEGKGRVYRIVKPT